VFILPVRTGRSLDLLQRDVESTAFGRGYVRSCRAVALQVFELTRFVEGWALAEVGGFLKVGDRLSPWRVARARVGLLRQTTIEAKGKVRQLLAVPLI